MLQCKMGSNAVAPSCGIWRAQRSNGLNYSLFIPATSRGSTALPLFLWLHGLGGGGLVGGDAWRRCHVPMPSMSTAGARLASCPDLCHDLPHKAHRRRALLLLASGP